MEPRGLRCQLGEGGLLEPITVQVGETGFRPVDGGASAGDSGFCGNPAHSFIPRPGIVLGAEDAAVASGLLPMGHSLWNNPTQGQCPGATETTALGSCPAP